MMERMRHDFTKESGLNFSRGKRAMLCSFVPKGKNPDYYHKARRELGYVTTPTHQIPNLKKRTIIIAHE